MAERDRTDFSEDFFADTRMSFGDHLEDLRAHLWRAIIGFAFFLMLGFLMDGIGYATGWPVGIGVPAMKIIQAPVIEQLDAFYQRRLDQVLEQMKTDPTLGGKNNPSDFSQQGVSRAEIEAILKGRPTAEINQVRKPAADDDILKLWMRHESPIEDAGSLEKARQMIGRRPGLSTLSVTEAFMVYFKVCLLCGLIMSSPWVFYQIWSFVAAGLYPHEKKLVNLYLPVSLGLFLGGVVMCQFLVLPRAVGALLWFNEWLGLEPDLRLNEWLGFAILMPLVFGISFQTPLVMFFLERIGIVTVETMQSSRRLAIFMLAVITAIITPTPDALTMMFLWVPLCGLYELGIIMCRLNPRPAWEDSEEPEETIEV